MIASLPKTGTHKMKDYFENTTQIKEDGYAAILRVKRWRQEIVCRCFSLVLAAPLLGRLVYVLILLIGGVVNHVQLRFLDVEFLL